MYIFLDELNVRSGCSTDDAVIGTLHYGDGTFFGGAWFDENGVEFYDQNNGTFVDSSNGDVFNVVG